VSGTLIQAAGAPQAGERGFLPSWFSAPASANDNSPPFSLWPLLLVIIAKPLADAFYETNAVKYGYMLALFYTAYFARCGHALNRTRGEASGDGVLGFVGLVAVYFYFLFGLGISFGGSLQQMFKIVSPFIFFALVAFAAGRHMGPALAIGAALVIVANAALIPFDFGWKTWGGVKTFKGIYYFKTDLAYALTLSVLMLAIHFRFAARPLLLATMALAALQVVLANSRLNYLAYALVLAFIAVQGGMSLRNLVRYGLLTAALAAIVAYTYGANKMLGFDVGNLGAFMQGRNQIWYHLFDSLLGFSPLQWLFGKGMYADILLSAEKTNIYMAHNAHNEFLHLIYTQGIVGLGLYVFLWYRMFRIAFGAGVAGWLRHAGYAAAGLFLLQSLTAVVSSYATKTWPVVLVLLMIRAAARGDDSRKRTAAAS
jgi:hypothetical protein